MSFLLYALNTLFACGQSSLGKLYARRGGDAAVFNLNKALAGVIIFLLFGLVQGLQPHIPSWLFGVAYGLFLGVSMHTGFQALACGPLALTSIVASFSLLIPFLWGILFWREGLTLTGVGGIALLSLTLLLLNRGGRAGLSRRWFFFAGLTLLTNGACSIVQKYHQLFWPGEYRNEFMIGAMLTVLCFTGGFHLRRPEHAPFSLNLCGLTAGAMNGLANYLVLFLAATEKASVLFPVVSVANTMAAWLAGRFLFRERLEARQLWGLGCGILAVLLLNLS